MCFTHLIQQPSVWGRITQHVLQITVYVRTDVEIELLMPWLCSFKSSLILQMTDFLDIFTVKEIQSAELRLIWHLEIAWTFFIRGLTSLEKMCQVWLVLFASR